MNFRPESGCDVAFERLKETGIVAIYKDQTPQAPSPSELQAQYSQAVLPSSQSRSSQEQRRIQSETYQDVDLSARPSQLRPSSSQAATISSSRPPLDHQREVAATDEDTSLTAPPSGPHFRQSSSVSGRLQHRSANPGPAPLQPCSTQYAYFNSQPGRQEYNYSADAPPSSVLSPRVRSRPHTSKSGSHPDDFSKPISYIQDPRSQGEIRSNSNDATYERPVANRPSFLSASEVPNAPEAMMPPPSRVLLPSPAFGNPSSSLGSYDTRSARAPETVSDSQLMDSVPISQLLPPQRILPFPDKMPSQNTDASPAPFEEPAVTENVDTKVTKRRKRPSTTKAKTSRKTPLPRSSAPTRRAKKRTTSEPLKPRSRDPPIAKAVPERRTATQERTNNDVPSNTPSETDGTLDTLERTVSRMKNAFTPPSSRDGNQRIPLSALPDGSNVERQHDIHDCASSPVAKVHQLEQLSDFLPDIPTKEFLDALDVWIQKHRKSLTHKPPKSTPEQLANYAAKPDEERARMIESLISGCLQDENFGKMWEDMERECKRICLGSKK